MYNRIHWDKNIYVLTTLRFTGIYVYIHKIKIPWNWFYEFFFFCPGLFSKLLTQFYSIFRIHANDHNYDDVGGNYEPELEVTHYDTEVNEVL